MAKYVKDKNGNTYTPEEYQRKQAELQRQHESRTKESTSTGSAYGDKMRSNWEREQKKSPQRTIEEKPVSKTRSTIEAKEKAKTRSAIEAAFVGNSKSAPPSREEQERMRKQGARNAANQYSWKYSGRRG